MDDPVTNETPERSDPLSGAVRVEDLERLAREVMPRPAFDYYAGGAGDEWTLAENRRAFERWVLRPRYLVDVSNVDLGTTVLGQPQPFPILLGPTAFHKLAHPDGELATARAAAAIGATMCAATSATATIEDVAATGVRPWFQLYVHRNRGVAEELVRRAHAAGCGAIVLTIDVPFLGLRERDVHNRVDEWWPPELQMANLVRPSDDAPGTQLFQRDPLIFDPSLTWKDLEWLHGLSPLPIVLKGVMTAEDALLAVDAGVDAIVVSNHGGRQLDGVAGTLDVLPEVVEAVAGRVEVLMDGGIRRGSDVVKAVALGARAVMIGRAYLWGLAVDGERGVRWVLETLCTELKLAMALTGAPSVDAIVRTMVAPAPR
jgi:4-hydroxymandelate oxidase